MKQKPQRISFGNAAISSLFSTALLMLVVTYVSTVSSAVIAGRIVGNDALCAVNLVTPLYSYATFFAGTIGIGSSLLYFRYLGAYNKERADEFFGQGIILALGIGALLFAAMVIGKNVYIDGLQVSESVRAEVEAFWRYEKYLIALAPIDFLLFELLYTDTHTCLAANAVFFVVGIGSSILFTNAYGTMGTSLGIVLGTVLCDLVLCTHFLGKKNIFSFRVHLSWSDIKEMCRLSLVDSSTYLDSGLLATFINAYVIRHFSESMLPIAAVMIAVLDIVVVFDSVGSAFAPVAEVYLGEENNEDELSVAKFSLSLAVAFGLIVFLLFYFLAPLVPGLLGLSDSAQIESAAASIRSFVPSMVFYSISYMLISHYIAVRRIYVAVAFEWTKAFIMPALCILIFGKLFGFNGMWVGFLPAEIISIFGFLAGIRLFGAKGNSIWLLEKNKYPTFSRSYLLKEEVIPAVTTDIEKFLTEKQIDRKIVLRIMITTEEMIKLLLKHNPKKKVIMQINAVVHENCVFLYERDNGSPFDLTDSDLSVAGLSEYIFSCMIDSCDRKKYLMAIDYNRSVFCYKFSESAVFDLALE